VEDARRAHGPAMGDVGVCASASGASAQTRAGRAAISSHHEARATERGQEREGHGRLLWGHGAARAPIRSYLGKTLSGRGGNLGRGAQDKRQTTRRGCRGRPGGWGVSFAPVLSLLLSLTLAAAPAQLPQPSGRCSCAARRCSRRGRRVAARGRPRARWKDRRRRAGTGGRARADAEALELTGLYLVPGLIDLHTHLLLHPTTRPSGTSRC